VIDSDKIEDLAVFCLSNSTNMILYDDSPFLSDLIVRHSNYAAWLTDELKTGRKKTRDEYLESARMAVESGLLELHRFQMREILRIGVRDLSGKVPMLDITNELSWLADAIIQTVLEYASREIEERYGSSDARLAVIGVGKLGGEELNFSSDIDIIYVYSEATFTDRCSRLARRITEILTEPTSEGMFYRVDLRLRPEGSRGAIALPLQTLRTYYDSWGETFERLALTKARVAAGDADIGQRFLELIEPFVYRKYVDFAAIDEIRDIKCRIDEQVKKSVGLERHVKLGRGGIREIEFFVQALQVLYGGEQRGIRAHSTLDALERLERIEIIGRKVAEQLRDAYIFLRNLEHKLQIVHHLQTHELPESLLELEKCARRMHMSLDEFRAALEKHRSAVQQTFRDLFPAKPLNDGIPGAVHRYVNGEMDKDVALKWLMSLDFKEPAQSIHNLELLRDAPAFSHSPMRMKNLLSNVLTLLFENLGGLIRPDTVLNRFERIVRGVGAREALYTSLLENPKSIYRLSRLLALSEYLSEIIFESPEGINFLIDESRFEHKSRNPFPTADRKLQDFYVGAQYFFGSVSRRHASRVLSRFAEQELRKVISDDSPVAVFAAGKLGEREMSFRSDLDVMVFYREDYDRAARIVEDLMKQMSPQFKLDLRLRPEGNKGPLVSSPHAYREYLHDRGDTWERMALTKARFVAGERDLGLTIQELINEFVYARPFGPPEIGEMNAIRKRMEHELCKETQDAWDLKVGRGGLVDIEFMVEYRQIEENVRIPNTIAAMKALRMDLQEEYDFLRDAQSMLRLWSTIASTRFERKDVDALSEMLHLGDFLGEYRRITEMVRTRFEERQ
jgi:[glutamine synthetase] adenylyltransferase / [glutamine synthetase]-adenylyl-L-tyrosine phosphorylase